ncbi:hypothetical protein PS2_006619 [Malus domestica]
MKTFEYSSDQPPPLPFHQPPPFFPHPKQFRRRQPHRSIRRRPRQRRGPIRRPLRPFWHLNDLEEPVVRARACRARTQANDAGAGGECKGRAEREIRKRGWSPDWMGGFERKVGGERCRRRRRKGDRGFLCWEKKKK